MEDKTRTPGKPPADVLALVGELRARAREHGDADAILAAEKAHDHAQAGDTAKVRFHLESLKTVAALAPLANAISNALASVGA